MIISVILLYRQGLLQLLVRIVCLMFMGRIEKPVLVANAIWCFLPEHVKAEFFYTAFFWNCKNDLISEMTFVIKCLLMKNQSNAFKIFFWNIKKKYVVWEVVILKYFSDFSIHSVSKFLFCKYVLFTNEMFPFEEIE